MNQICNIMELSDAELMFVDGGKDGGWFAPGSRAREFVGTVASTTATGAIGGSLGGPFGIAGTAAIGGAIGVIGWAIHDIITGGPTTQTSGGYGDGGCCDGGEGGDGGDGGGGGEC